MNYTEKLTKELERVTLRGNADKETIRSLAAIIFDMNERIEQLEGVAPEAEPAPVAEPVVEEQVEEPEAPKSNRRVGAKKEDK